MLLLLLQLLLLLLLLHLMLCAQLMGSHTCKRTSFS